MNKPLWYKDALFYEVYPRAFFDSNADGHGDLGGIYEKLDYLQELGIDCLWLLPIFESPLVDDGYDVSDFYKIQPRLGDLDSFKKLIAGAHARGMRVIADLVMNHTSNQHPWFIESRSSLHSIKRNYYLWSTNPQKFGAARIIFVDSQQSNWRFDPVTGEYYFHRFYPEQPDLNYDHPAVQQAIFDIIAYWLDQGLDGFRCDAVPYLFKREGTNSENLLETHEFLQRVRRLIDEKYPGTLLLAEANQLPAEARAYFGDGDEFHMAFHFPLMPQLFIALKKQDARPIIGVIERTPRIPDSTQWGIFLRNHDELTLEMVTSGERDFLWSQYAPDSRMRLNLGIRRRLAPLLDNDRRKIELAYALLLTLPGSPVLYYGDEIGMGDNLTLKDRDGVRTPMQWADALNAGFSQADPSRLYAPVIEDPEFGYPHVNVNAQQRDPGSLWRTLQRMIAVRKDYRAFGRGACEFISSSNPAVLAYIRQFEGEIMLILNNFSESPQRVSFDLSGLANRQPMPLLKQRTFPPIQTKPYPISLDAYEYSWLRL